MNILIITIMMGMAAVATLVVFIAGIFSLLHAWQSLYGRLWPWATKDQSPDDPMGLKPYVNSILALTTVKAADGKDYAMDPEEACRIIIRERTRSAAINAILAIILVVTATVVFFAGSKRMNALLPLISSAATMQLQEGSVLIINGRRYEMNASGDFITAKETELEKQGAVKPETDAEGSAKISN
jgi:hypothetical protein